MAKVPVITFVKNKTTISAAIINLITRSAVPIFVFIVVNFLKLRSLFEKSNEVTYVTEINDLYQCLNSQKIKDLLYTSN